MAKINDHNSFYLFLQNGYHGKQSSAGVPNNWLLKVSKTPRKYMLYFPAIPKINIYSSLACLVLKNVSRKNISEI